MEAQTVTFEKTVEKIDTKLDRLGGVESRLASVEAKLDSKAGAAEVAEIKGSLKYLPTIWQMIPLVIGIMGAAFAIVRYAAAH